MTHAQGIATDYVIPLFLDVRALNPQHAAEIVGAIRQHAAKKWGVPSSLEPQLLLRAAEALEAQAHIEAGCSQTPNLTREEDTQDWLDAQVLRSMCVIGA